MRRRSKRRRLGALVRRPDRIVVPMLDREPSRRALDLACRLAADGQSRLVLIAPLFVDLELPLDALFDKEEADLQAELHRELRIAESYGVPGEAIVVRTRHGQLGSDLTAAAAGASLFVLGAPIEVRPGFRSPFSRDVWSVIQDATCPVLIATEPTKSARAA